MRNLTLNEKISIKGKLLQKGLHLPGLTMADAIHYWTVFYGGSVAHWYKSGGSKSSSNLMRFKQYALLGVENKHRINGGVNDV